MGKMDILFMQTYNKDFIFHFSVLSQTIFKMLSQWHVTMIAGGERSVSKHLNKSFSNNYVRSPGKQ